MSQSKLARKFSDNFLEIKYYSFRNITSPEDKANDRTIYAGQMPINSIVNLSTNENVRE